MEQRAQIKPPWSPLCLPMFSWGSGHREVEFCRDLGVTLPSPIPSPNPFLQGCTHPPERNCGSSQPPKVPCRISLDLKPLLLPVLFAQSCSPSPGGQGGLAGMAAFPGTPSWSSTEQPPQSPLAVVAVQEQPHLGLCVCNTPWVLPGAKGAHTDV